MAFGQIWRIDDSAQALGQNVAFNLAETVVYR